MRTAGIALALAVGALVLGMLVFFYARGQGNTPAPDRRSADAPPDLDKLRDRTAGPGKTIVERARGTIIQWADKTDPSRKAGELAYDALEPLEGQRYNVTRPHIRVFRADGQEWDIRADGGKLYIPDTGSGGLGGGAGQSVESGTLTGNVTARLFRTAATSRRDDASAPDLTLSTDTFEFDGASYEMNAPRKVRIVGEGIESEVEGVTLLFSEVQERIELLRTHSGGWAKISPRRSVGTQETKAKPAAPAPPPAGAAPAPKPAPDQAKPNAPPETWYRAIFADGVDIRQGGRSLESQTATAYMHVIDGALPPGAFGNESPAPRTAAPRPQPAVASAAPSGASPPGSSAPPTVAASDPAAVLSDPLASGTDEPVLVTWKGPLELRPVETRPGMLAQDDVAVRFETPDGVVRLHDAEGNADGTTEILDYFATRREARLTGTGKPDATPPVWGVDLRSAGAGSLGAGDLAVNLATGLAVVQGAAVLDGAPGVSLESTQAASNADSKARIAWTDRGEFKFHAQNGKLTAALEEAMLYGNVHATDGTSELNGQILRAVFEPADSAPPAAKDAGSSVRLASMVVQNGVRGSDGRGGELTTDQLDVGFEQTAAGKTEPKLVVATGNVVGSRRTGQDDRSPVQTLTATTLTATLADSPTGRREIDQVHARGRVRFADGTGVRAESDELDGTMQDQRVTLRGRQALVAKDDPAAKARNAADHDGSTVRGQVIELDGLARTLSVPGAGRFDHRQTIDGVTKVAWANWSRSMKLDDAAGTLVAEGNARAESQPDPFTIEKLAGERVEMTMTPGLDDAQHSLAGSPPPAGQPAPSPSATNPAPSAQGSSPEPERQILTASVFGDGETPALVESRRYASPVVAAPPPADAMDGGDPAEPPSASPADAPKVLERLFYLESAQINADNVKGTISVPSPGKLLFADRRAPEQPAPGESAPAGFQGQVSRGDALFLWKGSLLAERAQNRVTFERSVRVVHLRPGDARPTEIEGERLVADLRPVDPDAASPGDFTPGELKSAAVTGAVWARSSDGKELVGDSLFYDALKGTVDALAAEGNEVTLFDPGSGVPVRARSILLDLNNNSFTVKQPGAITVPK